MSRKRERREMGADWSPDRALWRRSCRTEAPEDDVARFLDLAAFADGLLEPDEHDRVAAFLARDPATADDVAAARKIDGGAVEPPARLERIVARASAMVLASWLGFAMGSDTSRALSAPISSNDASFLPELFDPGSGFLRDLGEALRT